MNSSISFTTSQTTKAPEPSSNSEAEDFIHMLKTYTLPDIEKLKTVAKESERVEALNGTQRCSTALASMCFSAIEQVGLMTRFDLNSLDIDKEIKVGNQRNA